MKIRNVLLNVFLVFPVYMFASITGTYEVSGFDPETNQKYGGSIVIDKEGSVYTARWTLDGGEIDTGTGVRKDDFLSFVFRENNSNSFGTQLYEIDGHTLKGPWVRFDAERKGFEKLNKIED